MLTNSSFRIWVVKMIATVRKVKLLLLSDASLLRWCFFSVFSFAMVLGLTILLHEIFHLNEKIAFLTPLVIVFFTNFVTMRYFVYGKPTKPIHRQFLEYVLASFGFRALEYIAYWFFIDWLHIHYVVTVCLVMPTSFLSKFIFYKIIVFGPKSQISNHRTEVDLTTSSDELTTTDCSLLAALHIHCLPDSLVSHLGYSYAKSFYRYIRRSQQEFIFVHRNAGQIVSACVLSLSPKTLDRRLIKYTPLLLWVPFRLFRLPVGKIVKAILQPKLPAMLGTSVRSSVTFDRVPEVILIFTAPEARSRGFGSALLDRCESFLLGQGYHHYIIKTFDDETNRALRFYANNGFVERRPFVKYGKPFRLWEKSLTRQREV